MLLDVRITPAHAGKSHDRQRRQRQERGSPPPMRGKDADQLFGQHKRRITPAHAGKSNSVGRTICPTKDHPRPCGEKVIPRYAAGVVVGSPPPMRGKAAMAFCVTSLYRITPAHAGKSNAF